MRGIAAIFAMDVVVKFTLIFVVHWMYNSYLTMYEQSIFVDDPELFGFWPYVAIFLIGRRLLIFNGH